MSSFTPMHPDDFETMSPSTNSLSSSTRGQSPYPRPSIKSDSSDWYLSKRTSRGSRSSSSSNQSSVAAPKDNDGLTPLPPSLEVSLAILTAGLSVAALHTVKSISDRRAAKKRNSQIQYTDLSRNESVLVPSSVPQHQQQVPISELPTPTRSTPLAELGGSSPLDLPPPAYSVEETPSPTGKA